MRTPPLTRAAVDTVLGLLVGVLALTTSRLPEVDGRDSRHGWHGGGPPRSTDLPVAPDWTQVAAIAALVVALALRRAAPRAAHVGVLAAVTVFLLAGGPYGPVLLAPALSVHALVTRLPPRSWLPLLLAVPVSLTAGFWREPAAGLTDPGLYLAMVLGTAGIMLPGLIALVVTARRDAERQHLAAERRRAADEERLQIAREVHDVVGHSLAVINMQAGVALHLLQKRPDQLGPSLEAIRSTSKNALAELGSTLATLRGDVPSGPSDSRAIVGADRDRASTPAPDSAADPEVGVEPPTGLSRLDNLVAALRAAGRTVSYSRPPSDEPALSVAVQHAALRIAQEGLTNVVRHASADAEISVAITRDDAVLVVEVVDNGRSQGGFAEGSGIAGMRQRARAVGGRLDVGPLPGSGFRIRAEMPAPSRPVEHESLLPG